MAQLVQRRGGMRSQLGSMLSMNPNVSCHAVARALRGGAGCALLLGAFLYGCTPKPQEETAPTVSVQVEPAKKEPISRKVVSDAVLFPLNQAAIMPKVSAPVKKFYVQRGTPV